MASREIDAAYTRMLRAARTQANALGREALARITLALTEAARAIEFDLQTSDNPVTVARAESLREQIRGLLTTLELATVRATERAVTLTVEQVLAMHQQVTRELFSRFLDRSIAGLAGRFDQLALRPLLLIAARPANAATFQTLIRRHLEEAAPAVDSLINAAVVRGVSTRRLTKDLTALMTDAVPPPTALYGLPYSDLSGLGTIRSDAERIAVSETLNALRESNARGMAVSPIVLGAQWCLSGRHDGLRSSPDECDVLAELDFYGMGPGWYPADHWPFSPHSRCGCYQCRTRFRPPSDWGSPKPDAPELALEPARLDFAVVGVRGSEDWTEMRAERARQTLSRSIFRREPPRRRRAA